MKIRRATRAEFDIRHYGNSYLHQELEWYATDNKAVIGLLVRDKQDNDFGWLVMTQNGQGPGYTCVMCGTGLPTKDLAYRMLCTAMETAPEVYQQ